MGRQVCYLSGVTGAGKTTLSKAFVQEHAGWKRVSGGDMIMRATGQLPEAERDKLRDMTGYVARQNQLLILKSFHEVKTEIREHILFDGQCLVRAFDGVLRPIPASIAVRMGITKVVYLEEPPEVILERRKGDAERPGREDESLDEIAARLVVSEEICRRYARKAGVPFVHLVSPTSAAFAAAVL